MRGVAPSREEYVPGSDEIICRRLADGSGHRLVKVFVHPGQLRARLAELAAQWDRRLDTIKRLAETAHAENKKRNRHDR
jgi:hypothetical protein